MFRKPFTEQVLRNAENYRVLLHTPVGAQAVMPASSQRVFHK